MNIKAVALHITLFKLTGFLLASIVLTACSNLRVDTANEAYQRATVTAVKDVSVIIRNHYYPSYVGIMNDNMYDENNISGESVWNDRADIELLRDVSLKTEQGQVMTVRQDRRYKFRQGEAVKLVERVGVALVVPLHN